MSRLLELLALFITIAYRVGSKWNTSCLTSVRGMSWVRGRPLRYETKGPKRYIQAGHLRLGPEQVLASTKSPSVSFSFKAPGM